MLRKPGILDLPWWVILTEYGLVLGLRIALLLVIVCSHTPLMH